MTNEEIKYVESLKVMIATQKQLIENQDKIITNDGVIINALEDSKTMLKRIITRLVNGDFQSEEDRKKLLELCK